MDEWIDVLPSPPQHTQWTTTQSIKKKDILQLTTTWRDLEDIMLSEMSQDRQRQIWHDFTYMWNIKNKHINETKPRLRYR